MIEPASGRCGLVSLDNVARHRRRDRKPARIPETWDARTSDGFPCRRDSGEPGALKVGDQLSDLARHTLEIATRRFGFPASTPARTNARHHLRTPGLGEYGRHFSLPRMNTDEHGFTAANGRKSRKIF